MARMSSMLNFASHKDNMKIANDTEVFDARFLHQRNGASKTSVPLSIFIMTRAIRKTFSPKHKILNDTEVFDARFFALCKDKNKIPIDTEVFDARFLV